MKLRILPVAVAVVAALLIPTAGMTPAYADPPPAPDFSGIDSSTAGHLTGTISSPGSPEVYIRFSNDVGVTYRNVTLAGDSDTFDLPTWGYSGLTSVYAYTCLTAAQNAGECSTETVVASFTPTDVTPSTTWSSDTTVGPADDVSVEVTDTGGGVLFGQWTDDNPDPDPARFSIDQNGETTASISDGVGQVHVYRCDAQNTDQCTELAGAISPSYDVRTTTTATVGAVDPVSPAHPTTSMDITTPNTGTYTVSWHLESGGDPVPGYGATDVAGTLTAGVATVPIDATGLPGGTYQIVGTITVVDTAFGTYTDVPLTGGTLTADSSGPAIDSITASPTTFYPRITGDSKYKSTTKFTIVGAGVPDIATLKLYKNSTGAFVRTLTNITQVDPTHATVGWTGKLVDGTLVPSGLYKLKVYDADGNVSSTVGSVTVSGLTLVLKTWTHTYTPAGTLADKYVGKCSTLRQPSRRGWYYSLGYYANTKCTSQTAKDSLVSTLHSVFLPKVHQYVDIRVTAYGGSAVAKPGSKAVIRYLNTDGDWTSEKTMASTMGYHPGYTKSTNGLVFSDRSFGWGFYTGFGYQYDVKNFTIVLRYKTLG